jgi:hypothetical protein
LDRAIEQVLDNLDKEIDALGLGVEDRRAKVERLKKIIEEAKEAPRIIERLEEEIETYLGLQKELSKNWHAINDAEADRIRSKQERALSQGSMVMA